MRDAFGKLWLLTGDMATVDERGYFRIVDRKKDLIIAGGHNIYPREVEEALMLHPAVLEAAAAPVVTPPAVPAAGVQPIWTQMKQSQIAIPAELRLPPGTREFYIPVTVDHADRESFYCYVSGFTNVSGGGINVGNAASQRANFSGWENVVYRWSPGDDLTHYVKVTTKAAYTEGKVFGVMVAVVGLGDKQKGGRVNIVFDAAAPWPLGDATFWYPSSSEMSISLCSNVSALAVLPAR